MADAETLFATAVRHSRPEEPAGGVPGEGDTKSGAAPMIAVERHCSGIQPVVDDLAEQSDADLDGTGDVGILDLLALLAAWGSDPGGPPDFDGDGNVGILDLLALLAVWGPCP